MSTNVIAIYGIANLLMAVAILVVSRRSLSSKLYAFSVGLILVFGMSAIALDGAFIPYLAGAHLSAALFIYSIFPSFFLHFITIHYKQTGLVLTRSHLMAIYGVGMISYVAVGTGLLPGPIDAGGGITSTGAVFYTIWSSVLFALGIGIFYSHLRGFREKNLRTNVVMSGFLVLILILPGPFAESVTRTILNMGTEWYFLSSTIGLVIAVSLIFWNKLMQNAPYQSLSAAIEAMNDVMDERCDDCDRWILQDRDGARIGQENPRLS